MLVHVGPGSTSGCCALIAALALAAPAAATTIKPGALEQLPGAAGCLVDRSEAKQRCTLRARAARPGAVPRLRSASRSALTGSNVYVASSSSNAIAIFKRNAKHREADASARAPPAASPPAARSGCAPARRARRRRTRSPSAPTARTSTRPRSPATRSPIFSRNPSTGALTQATDGSGCIANAATTGCTTGRALDGPDVVDGQSRTATTSTWARSSATRSRCSPATRPPAR